MCGFEREVTGLLWLIFGMGMLAWADLSQKRDDRDDHRNKPGYKLD